MKRMLGMAFALLVLFAQLMPVFATDTTPPTPEPTAPVEIYKLIAPIEDVAWLPLVPLGSDIADSLPQTVYGYYGRFSLIECPVVWDTAALTEPGRYVVAGSVTAPDGYVLKEGEGLERTTLPVAVYGDAPVAFFDLSDDYKTAASATVVLAKNSDVADVTNRLPYDNLDLTNADGDALRVPAAWDLTDLDIATVGYYTVHAAPQMPSGAALLEPDARTAQNVYVMEENAVDLGGFCVGESEISCPWLTTIDPAQAVLELSFDGEHWLAAEQAIPGYDYYIYERSLRLDTADLEVGKEYFFRLVYQNASEGVLRVVIAENDVAKPEWGGDRDGGDYEDDTVDPPIQVMPPTPPSTISPPDGTDTTPTEPTPGPSATAQPSATPKPSATSTPVPSASPAPDETPEGSNEPAASAAPVPSAAPAPSASPVPSVSPAPCVSPAPPVSPPPSAGSEAGSGGGSSEVPAVASSGATSQKPKAQTPQPSAIPGEVVTHDTLTLSGARLAWMLEQGADPLPFGWNGISVEIPAAFLAGLALDPQETLSLTLTKQSADAFTIALSAGGEAISEIAPTTVRFSCSAQKAAPVLFLADTQLETPVRYESGCAVFSITQTGRYRLAEDSNAATAQPTAIPVQSAVEAVAAVEQPQPSAVDFLPVAGAAVLCLGGALVWLRRKRR